MNPLKRQKIFILNPIDINPIFEIYIKTNYIKQRSLLTAVQSMIPQRKKQFQELATELRLKTRQLRTIRDNFHQQLQNSNHPQIYNQFRSVVKEQKKILDQITEAMKHQMHNQISQRNQIYDFELENLLYYVQHYYLRDYPMYKQFQPLRKINKMSQKFLTSMYDFTDKQAMGLLIYSYTYDWARIPVEHDFQLLHRIINKLAQFNHIDLVYELAFEQINMLVLILHQNPNKCLRKKEMMVRLMIKFNIIGINIYTIKLFKSHSYLFICMEFLDINVMVLAGISRNNVLKNISDDIFAEVLNEQDTKIVDTLSKMLFDFVPWLFHLMQINGSSQIHILVIESLISFSKFQRKALPKIQFQNVMFKLEDISEKHKLSLFEQQLAKVLYQCKIVDWISNNIQCWVNKLSTILDVIALLELIVFRISMVDFKQKLIPVMEMLINLPLIKSKWNWLFQFVYRNKKTENAELFRQIFIERQLLSKILAELESPVSYLEQNETFDLDSGNFITHKLQIIVLKTMLAIEICRACEMKPFSIIVKSAQIVLKMKLNCYWMNEFMETFLNENPIMANEIMEIQG